MSLTYKQIQDAVLSDAFGEAKRADVKNWIQFRHAWLWDIEEWTFKQATANVSVTAGSQTVGSLPSDFQTVLALWDSNGDRMVAYRNPTEFLDGYNSNLVSTGSLPSGYTVIGSSILVGPTPSASSSSYLLAYQKRKPSLLDDTDTTGLPEGYDVALIHGAKSEGFKLGVIPGLAGDLDADFRGALDVLRRTYLTGIRTDDGAQWGAYCP